MIFILLIVNDMDFKQKYLFPQALRFVPSVICSHFTTLFTTSGEKVGLCVSYTKELNEFTIENFKCNEKYTL